MPYTLSDPLSTNNAFQGSVYEVDYKYKYPHGFDLKPGSELHQRIITEVKNRAQDGWNVMNKRHDSWHDIDRVLTAYVSPKKKKEAIDKGDKTWPVIIPTSYATLDTLLTYMTSVFLQVPYFNYTGTGPEDTIGAMLLEQTVSFQAIKARMGLNLHTLWRDSFSYGFGALTPYWGQKMGWRREAVEPTKISNMFFKGKRRRRKVRTVLYEGNYLRNIDPYLYIPDPTVAVQDVQDGEFVGWVDISNRVKILEEEKAPESFFFNAKYLRHVTGRTSVVRGMGRRSEMPRHARQNETMHMSSTKPVDRIFMYVNLIPEEWKMGDSAYPEKWLFVVASDSVVLAAQKLGLDHDMFPVVIAAPDYDGYSVTPISRLEIGYGIQEILDWMLHSHIANVRKAINDMIIVDPFLVNMKDVRDPGPGKIIRTRRANWGKGVSDVMQQFKVTDVTANHMRDIAVLTDMHNKSTGAVDVLQGARRKGGERVSATESRDTKQSALSKLEKAAVIMDIQYRQPLAYMLASHTQQFMSEETYVGITGQREQELMQERGIELDSQGKVSVNPLDLLIHYDVLPGNGTIPGREPADMWIQLFQILTSQPEVAQQFDMVRIFQHAARQLGAKNVHDFIRKGGNIQPKLTPDEEVIKANEAGDLEQVGA